MLQTNIADGVLTITFDRPDKFNSFNRELALGVQSAQLSHVCGVLLQALEKRYSFAKNDYLGLLTMQPAGTERQHTCPDILCILAVVF